MDFIEIYNQSDKFINLNSIFIGNDREMPIAVNHFIIEPKQHLAMTKDPIILNNHYPGIDMKNVIRTVDLPRFNND